MKHKQIIVELQDFMGSDRAIADAAWTSSTEYTKKTAKTDEDVKRIVNMLADSKHSVPFESVVLRFHIRMPIAIDRQFMTHRLQSASGMSGRYRTMPDEFLEMPQDVKDIIDLATGKAYLYEFQYNKICQEANTLYRTQLTDLRAAEKSGAITNKEYKRVREFLRGELPQHNMTERVSVMNLRALSNFLKLRGKEDAQLEIRVIAEQMLQELETKSVCPVALEAIKRNNWAI
jgi:thymidylate synthase (FAD)